MGDFGNAFVDFNKEFFGSVQGALDAAGSTELDIYGGVQGLYHALGLGSLRG